MWKPMTRGWQVLGVAAALVACSAPGGGSPDGGPSDAGVGGPLIVIFSAFPAETEAVLAYATIDSTQVFNGRTFRIGTLNGVRVAIGLTGMGLDNATTTSRAVLAALPVKGVVFSGVAGSALRIGDVIAPVSWSLKGMTTYAADPQWLAIARDVFDAGTSCFDNCTITSGGAQVCLDHTPSATVAGTGESDEISVVLPCTDGGDDLFGCDIGATTALGPCQTQGAFSGDAGTGPIVTDNETAAVAGEAAARALPFIGFRGISDGADDPLGLPGYPTQFFAYYRLAAANAGAATAAFVARVGTSTP